MGARVYDWAAEREKRGAQPVMGLGRTAPNAPRHSQEGDDAFACNSCGALYYSIVLRAGKLGLICYGCGEVHDFRQILTEAGI